MRNLPIEVISAVVQNVATTEDLLHLRSLNWSYKELVTPRVFSTLHIKNSIQSAQNCHQIIGTASLATHVREVVYDSRDDECFQLPPDNVGNDVLEVSELEEALTEAFCAITALPRIDRVVLNFWPSFLSQSGREVRETPFWFTNRQLTLLHAIHHGMKTSRMTTLFVNNVILPATCHDFISSLTSSPLSHLSISVVSNAEVSAWSGSKNVNGSLGALLPPSNPTLKSLVLSSPQGPYHSLTTRLSSFYYPSLESLVLENIVFDQMPFADGVEEFVLRHKDTLQRLELQSCACHIPGSSTDARRWSTIWQRWAAELTSLREIVVNNDGHSYVLLDADQGCIPHGLLSTTTTEDDSSSLQMFKDTIAAGRVVVM
ncbi:uncharacterized protein EDB91DRAFT_1255514 [Suillus paluster]|uniref:uncharacterized protein n=1 Tax=Suillus paluster TaxID=48578 RepID=UPI001B865A0E|nr:uncharacterized protein EDB91DRAFT_1255514 [Suillus paluster]KAG1723777.1 hypothetical protein EDB91DRAFT_1255514 [Suillus paluster]